MANIQLSAGLANSIANSSGFDQFNSGTLTLYSSSQPTNANSSIGAQDVLAVINLPADAFGAPSTGDIAFSGTWQTTAANAAGTASWFRLLESGGTSSNSTAELRLDGSVTSSAGGGDLELNNTAISSGQTVSINAFTVTMPLTSSG